MLRICEGCRDPLLVDRFEGDSRRCRRCGPAKPGDRPLTLAERAELAATRPPLPPDPPGRNAPPPLPRCIGCGRRFPPHLFARRADGRRAPLCLGCDIA